MYTRAGRPKYLLIRARGSQLFMKPGVLDSTTKLACCPAGSYHAGLASHRSGASVGFSRALTLTWPSVWTVTMLLSQ